MKLRAAALLLLLAAALPPLSLSLSLVILTVDAVLALKSKEAERPLSLAFVFFALLSPPLLTLDVTRNEFYQFSSVCKRMPKAHRDRERQLDSRHLRQIPTTK